MTQHIESLKVEREYDDFVVTIKLSKSAWWSIKTLIENIVEGQGIIDKSVYVESDSDFELLDQLHDELVNDYSEALL